MVVWRSALSGGFQDPGLFPGEEIPVGETPVSADLGDLNGDGILDAVIANSDGDTVSILLGRGDGTFADQATYPILWALSSGPFLAEY